MKFRGFSVILNRKNLISLQKGCCTFSLSITGSFINIVVLIKNGVSHPAVVFKAKLHFAFVLHSPSSSFILEFCTLCSCFFNHSHHPTYISRSLSFKILPEIQLTRMAEPQTKKPRVGIE